MNDVGVEVNGRSSFRGWGIASLISAAMLLGCGGSSDQFPTAKVSGKVTVGGQPVTGGELIFSPIVAAGAKGPKGAGKNGIGAVKSDGTYTVSTYGSGDGAVIAKHNVVFVPAAVTTPAAPAGGHAQTPPSPYMGMKPSPGEVTVSKGENKVDIELVK